MSASEIQPEPHSPAKVSALTLGRLEFSTERLVLMLLLVVGLAIRSVVVFQSTNLLHPDEIFQYLEQGHRLAFGSGVVPWEYDYGIRSWLLPIVIAAIMKLCSWITLSPLLYIYTLRFLSAALSLTVIVFGFQGVLPKAGLAWATITGFFCATWLHAIYLSPAILTEVLAAYVMFPAVYLASDAPRSTRTAAVLGALLGLTLCLRFQMVPALAVIAAWYCRTDLRHKWLALMLSGSIVAIALAGVIDVLALGRPFQSIWLNFYLNAFEGISTNFGRKGWFAYFDYLTFHESVIAIPLGVLALIGCYRAPLLALSALAVAVSHSFFAHKEYRFIAFVLLSLPILMGHGAAIVSETLRQCLGKIPALVAAVALAASVPIASMLGWASGMPVGPAPYAAVLRLFLTAHSQQDLCGLGVADYHWSLTGGYTYLNRQVPLYVSAFLRPTSRQGYYLDHLQRYSTAGPPVPLQMHVELDHRTITQFPSGALFRNVNAFNYLVVRQGHIVPGYAIVACSGTANPLRACLVKRPGRCSPP